MVGEKVLNWIFSPLTSHLSARWSIIVISFIITLIVTLIYKYTTDQKLLKGIREEMKQLQQEAKKHRENPEHMMQINQEILKKNGILMKSSLKPTLFTLIPIIIIFGWLRTTFGAETNLINIFGIKFGWLGTYILSSIVFSIVLRKSMRVA